MGDKWRNPIQFADVVSPPEYEVDAKTGEIGSPVLSRELSIEEAKAMFPQPVDPNREKRTLHNRPVRLDPSLSDGEIRMSPRTWAALVNEYGFRAFLSMPIEKESNAEANP